MKLLEQIRLLDFPASLPEALLEVRQSFDAPRVADVAAAARRALEENGLLEQIGAAESVALGVGSRGIANLPVIVRAVIKRLREVGAHPFVVPAMGSHGGATAQGQLRILAELGITAQSIDATIRATMDVNRIGQLPDGPALFQDAIAAAADHTLLINRVKPHTDFRGQLESGLAKMAVIGLGHQRGASAMHAYGTSGFQQFLAPAARVFEENTNLVGGLAILENAYDETAEIVGLTAQEIGSEREKCLQEKSKTLMASLPFSKIDVLVVRDIGKNISGTGMDTNIIGRLMIPGQPEDLDGPEIAVIVVLDLTEETHGNAAGIGLANVTTARLARKIDWSATYTNAITSGIFGMQRVSLPITMADDRRALRAGLRGCGQLDESASMVFIKDTLTLDRLWVSPNLQPLVDSHPRTSVEGEVPLEFTDEGLLVKPWRLK